MSSRSRESVRVSKPTSPASRALHLRTGILLAWTSRVSRQSKSPEPGEKVHRESDAQMRCLTALEPSAPMTNKRRGSAPIVRPLGEYLDEVVESQDIQWMQDLLEE